VSARDEKLRRTTGDAVTDECDPKLMPRHELEQEVTALRAETVHWIERVKLVEARALLAEAVLRGDWDEQLIKPASSATSEPEPAPVPARTDAEVMQDARTPYCTRLEAGQRCPHRAVWVCACAGCAPSENKSFACGVHYGNGCARARDGAIYWVHHAERNEG
jgi:hypothetical protein